MLGNKTRYFSLLILSLGLPSKVLCRSNERLNGLERTKSILRHDSKGATPRFSRLGYISPPSNVKEIQRGGDNDVPAGKLYSQLKIISYFALWYILNIQYNIVNKLLLNIIPLPITIGTAQFFVGSLYVAMTWLTKLRAAPKLDTITKSVSLVAVTHASGQLLSMISLCSGPVSFTHVVKALEPFFSAIVSGLFFGKWMPWQVYASLIPVVGGVGVACLKELNFSWISFWGAMGSNLAFALRAVGSKIVMGAGEWTSANLFGMVTILASFMSVPVVFASEGLSIFSLWKKVISSTVNSEGITVEAITTSAKLIRAVFISGLFHYLNNEVMYLALSKVHPVTLAVGNTMKRVFVMVAAVIVFQNPVSFQAGVGSAIGIGGVLLYSLVRNRYEELEKKED